MQSGIEPGNLAQWEAVRVATLAARVAILGAVLTAVGLALTWWRARKAGASERAAKASQDEAAASAGRAARALETIATATGGQVDEMRLLRLAEQERASGAATAARENARARGARLGARSWFATDSGKRRGIIEFNISGDSPATSIRLELSAHGEQLAAVPLLDRLSERSPGGRERWPPFVLPSGVQPTDVTGFLVYESLGYTFQVQLEDLRWNEGIFEFEAPSPKARLRE